MTRKFGWSKNVLVHQIENQSYEKTLLNQTNFKQTLTPELRAQANLAVKDEYTFDFLELGEEHAAGSWNAPSSRASQIFSAPWADCSAVEKACAAAEEELQTINALPAALLRRAFKGEL